MISNHLSCRIIQISGELYDLDKAFDKKKNATLGEGNDGKCTGLVKVKAMQIYNQNYCSIIGVAGQ